MRTRHSVARSFAAFGIGLFLAGSAQAAAILTAQGIADGFTLTTFADGFPNNGSVGPLGIGFTPTGAVMVVDYPGRIAVFATDTDGQHYSGATLSTTNYGFNSPVGIAQVGGRYYLSRQNIGEVDEVTAAGDYIRTVVTGISFATGMVGNPFTGKMYVSDCCTGTGIWEVDPNTNTKVQKIAGSFDGLTLNADGSILYAEIGGTIVGYNTTTFAPVYNSGFITGGPDGVAIGTGSLAGKLFINTNAGQLWEQDITSHVLTLLMTGGSRGDFVQVDPNNGSLLITQTDLVLRLTAPAGGGFEGGTAPEPGSLALVALGLAALRFRRRRAG
jgi:hypothetical protein